MKDELDSLIAKYSVSLDVRPETIGELKKSIATIKRENKPKKPTRPGKNAVISISIAPFHQDLLANNDDSMIEVVEMPMTAISPPDNTKTKPDQIETKPDQIETKPDQTETKPDNTKSKPDQTETKPDQTETNNQSSAILSGNWMAVGPESFVGQTISIDDKKYQVVEDTGTYYLLDESEEPVALWDDNKNDWNFDVEPDDDDSEDEEDDSEDEDDDSENDDDDDELKAEEY